MRRIGRTFLSASAIAGVTLALAACGSGDSDSTASVDTLTVWDAQPYEPFHSAFVDQLAACAPDGVEVRQETIPGDQFVTRTLSSSSTGDLPDVVVPEGDQIHEFARAGIVAELGRYGIDTDDRSDVVAGMGVVDGELYGVAQNVNTLALFYNTEMFATAGLEPPSTWPELVDAAARLTEGRRRGITLAADASSSTGGYMFLPWFLSAGGDPEELDGEPMERTLQLYADLVGSGGASKEIVNLAWDANDSFLSEDAAMMVSQEFSVEQLDAAGIGYGVVTVPTPTGAGTPRTALGGQVLAVTATTDERQELAAELVACLVSHENQVAMAEATGRTPASTQAREEYAAAHPEMRAFAGLVDSAYYTPAIGEVWADKRDQISAAVQLVVAAGASPRDAMDQAIRE